MPRIVTLSDDEFAALQAIRLVVADSPHPARPAAIAALDRIAAAPADEPRFPVVTRSGAQPLDMYHPDGHRSSLLEWRSDWDRTDIQIPAGQDLVFELRRPAGSPVLQWRVEAGDPDHRRALWRLSFQAITRPVR